MMDIKPCPFCGEIPDATADRCFETEDGYKWGGVVCCCVGPTIRTKYGPIEEWRDEAIEEWNKRADGARWIPTADRMPDTVADCCEDHSVFVYVIDLGVRLAVWAPPTLTGGAGEWWDSNDSSCYEVSDVTHWQPVEMPEPPKESDAN